MKIRLLLLITIFSFGFSSAQIINIPDANFKTRLLQASTSQNIAYNAAGVRMKIDTNSDSQIQVSEAALVHQLFIQNRNVVDMTGVEAFTNLRVLNCVINQINNLPLAGLNNLTELTVWSNQLTSINISNLTNLKKIDCSSNQLTSLAVDNLLTLEQLHCHNNQITSLNTINLTNLKYFNCSNNPLVSFSFSHLINLESLGCGGLGLNSLDLTPLTNLKSLSCFDNNLTILNLINYPGLNSLSCSNNPLTTLNLPPVLNSLTTLDIENTNRNSFDFSICPNLEFLYCGKNPFTALNFPNLPDLKWLDINTLTATIASNVMANSANFPQLEVLNLTDTPLGSVTLIGAQFPNLQTFILRNCSLTQLQVAHPNVYNLYVSNNQLNALDVSNLPALLQLEAWNNPYNTIIFNYNAPLRTVSAGGVGSSMTSLDLSAFNQLSYVSFTGSPLLENFNIKNGAAETTVNFANCPNMQYICADENQLTTIQNKINTYGYTNCFVNSYCSFVPGGTYYTINGNNKYDANTNGCTSADANMPHLKLNFTNGTNMSNLIPDNSGNYTYNVQAGTHTITPVLENPSYFTVSPTSAIITFPTATSPATQNFCIAPNGSFSDMEVIIFPISEGRPGEDAKYKIVYRNKGNVAIANGSVNLTYNNSVLDFVTATPNFSSQNSTSFSWNFTNLQPFETRQITLMLNLNGPMESPALNSGDVLSFVATVSSAEIDTTPADNNNTFSQTLTNSLDPNDKTCTEGTTIAPIQVGQYVHYVIRFENSGTANALNIVVRDMIDTSKFDITSLIPLSASHSFVTRIINTNQVEFIFQNINLPFDDANNDGYVTFKIKTKATLVEGDTFSNSANIYFDYNFPIATNNYTTTVQTLGIDENVEENTISVYPNPVKGILNFDTMENITKVEVYDIAGRILSSNAVNYNQLNLSGLQAGNYILKIFTESSSTYTKIIKE